jgi:ATP-binding cassette subfamily B protein
MIPYPILILATRYFAKAMFVRSRESQEALAALAERAQESIAGVRVVRSLALEDHEERRFALANAVALDRNMKLVVLRGFLWPLLMAINALGVLIVVWLGGSMVLDGELSVGQFAAFNAYLGQLIWPTMAFGFMLSVLQRGRASYDRIREVLDSPPDVVDPPRPQSPMGIGGLRVTDLSFTYPGGDRPALAGISFDVPAGSTVAVVGRTGSGKSTLAALLPRLLPTPPGTVSFDGINRPIEVGSSR